MRSSTVTFVLTFVLSITGCATTEGARGERGGGPTTPPPSRAGHSEAAAIAAASFECILHGEERRELCQRLAADVRVPVESITAAEPSAIDALGERVASTAQREGLPYYLRSDLSRWFELASGAAREALAARMAAEGQAARTITEGRNGEPSAADLADARALALSRLRAHTRLDELARFAGESQDLAPEAEASALLVIAHRIETARRAPADLRDAAANAVIEALGALPSAPGSALGGGPPSAPLPRGAAALDEAERMVERRLREVAPRVGEPALRTAVERRAA